MNVLVLGGNGYLGNVLCPKLLEVGHSVTSIDLHWFGDCLSDTVRKIKGDICDKKLMCREIQAHDLVIHLAGMVCPAICDVFPMEVYKINYFSSRHIAKYCRDKRLIYVSSCSIYGFDEERFLDEEITDMFPVSLYGITKAKSERLFYEHVPRATLLRTGTLYGDSPRMRYDLIANLFIARGLNKLPLMVHGGDQWRPMICVDDLADIIVWSIANDVIGVFNTLHNNYTIKLLAEIIAGRLRVPIEIDENKSDVRSVIAKSDKLRECGFVPRKSILDVIDQIQQNSTWKEFDNIKYSNAACTSSLEQQGHGSVKSIVQ